MSGIIFFDGECPLCHRAIHFILKHDKKKQFLFAPLQGETARAKLPSLHLNDLDTLVYLQADGKILIEGRAVLRLAWRMGGLLKPLGLLSFLPRFLFDPLYRFIARNRFRLFSGAKIDTFPPERLLP